MKHMEMNVPSSYEACIAAEQNVSSQIMCGNAKNTGLNGLEEDDKCIETVVSDTAQCGTDMRLATLQRQQVYLNTQQQPNAEKTATEIAVSAAEALIESLMQLEGQPSPIWDPFSLDFLDSPQQQNMTTESVNGNNVDDGVSSVSKKMLLKFQSFLGDPHEIMVQQHQDPFYLFQSEQTRELRNSFETVNSSENAMFAPLPLLHCLNNSVPPKMLSGMEQNGGRVAYTMPELMPIEDGNGSIGARADGDELQTQRNGNKNNNAMQNKNVTYGSGHGFELGANHTPLNANDANGNNATNQHQNTSVNIQTEHVRGLIDYNASRHLPQSPMVETFPTPGYVNKSVLPSMPTLIEQNGDLEAYNIFEHSPIEENNGRTEACAGGGAQQQQRNINNARNVNAVNEEQEDLDSSISSQTTDSSEQSSPMSSPPQSSSPMASPPRPLYYIKKSKNSMVSPMPIAMEQSGNLHPNRNGSSSTVARARSGRQPHQRNTSNHNNATRDNTSMRRLGRGNGSGASRTSSNPQSESCLFKCLTCGKQFKHKSTYTQHNRIHTGARPFPCSECGKRFRQMAHLNQHMLIHTNEKPFPCTYCHRNFRQRSILIQHIRTHSGEKPFACGECGRYFRQKAILNSHIRTHETKRR